MAGRRGEGGRCARDRGMDGASWAGPARYLYALRWPGPLADFPRATAFPRAWLGTRPRLMRSPSDAFLSPSAPLRGESSRN